MKKYLIMIGFILLATMAEAQTIDDILLSITQNNASLKAIQHGNTAIEAESRGSNMLTAPSVEYSPFYKKGYSGVASSELIVSQEFDFPTIYGKRARVLKEERKALTASYEVARRNLLWEAEQICLALVLLDNQRTLLRERLQGADSLLVFFEKRMAYGDATQLDINKIKLEKMARKADLEQNEAERKQLQLSLIAMNNMQTLDFSRLSYPNHLMDCATDQTVLMQKSNDAEITEGKQQVEFAKAQASEKKMGWLPKLTVGYRRNTEEKFSSNGILVGMAFPLYSNKRQIQATKARMNEAEMQAQHIYNKVESELTSDIQRLTHYRTAIASYDTNMLSESLHLLHKAVTAGEISVIEYYTEAELIYQQWQIYQQLENDCQVLHAKIHRNELLKKY